MWQQQGQIAQPAVVIYRPASMPGSGAMALAGGWAACLHALTSGVASSNSTSWMLGSMPAYADQRCCIWPQPYPGTWLAVAAAPALSPAACLAAVPGHARAAYPDIVVSGVSISPAAGLAVGLALAMLSSQPGSMSPGVVACVAAAVTVAIPDSMSGRGSSDGGGNCPRVLYFATLNNWKWRAAPRALH